MMHQRNSNRTIEWKKTNYVSRVAKVTYIDHSGQVHKRNYAVKVDTDGSLELDRILQKLDNAGCTLIKVIDITKAEIRVLTTFNTLDKIALEMENS